MAGKRWVASGGAWAAEGSAGVGIGMGTAGRSFERVVARVERVVFILGGIVVVRCPFFVQLALVIFLRADNSARLPPSTTLAIASRPFHSSSLRKSLCTSKVHRA